MEVDSEVVLSLMQQLYPDQFARCVAEAKVIKLQQELENVQSANA